MGNPMGRPGLPQGVLDEMWRRYQAGEHITGIARVMGYPMISLRWLIKQRGGVAPRPRRRPASALSEREREAISRGIAAGRTVRALARDLARAPSTISREIQRNGGPARYRALLAERRARFHARRPKVCRLRTEPRLCAVVATKLAANWSPRQISGFLQLTYPDDARMQVSHETIYRSLFMQTRGALKRELQAHLRTHRVMRRSKHATHRGQGRGDIANAVSISERPAAVADRAVPGHWEGDLIQGANFTFIATLVERWSRYVHLVRVTSKETDVVTAALIREVRRLPTGLMASLTWDRGKEMAQHRRFTVATDVAVYFCDPRSPWQRGSNENTNGLLRQYFPKGMDLSQVTQRQLDAVARQLNTRPRETLGFRTPAAMFAEAVALTG